MMVVYSLDRFARNNYDHCAVRPLLANLGMTLRSDRGRPSAGENVIHFDLPEVLPRLVILRLSWSPESSSFPPIIRLEWVRRP